MESLNTWIAGAGYYRTAGATRVSALEGWRGIAIALILISFYFLENPVRRYLNDRLRA